MPELPLFDVDTAAVAPRLPVQEDGVGGRWPLLLGTMTLAALVIRGVDPLRLVDPWVPFVPLLAFLLTVVLVWHTALGRPQALVAAVAVGTFTAQTHLTYVSLNGMLAVWLAAWWWRGPRPWPGRI